MGQRLSSAKSNNTTPGQFPTGSVTHSAIIATETDRRGDLAEVLPRKEKRLYPRGGIAHGYFPSPTLADVRTNLYSRLRRPRLLERAKRCRAVQRHTKFEKVCSQKPVREEIINNEARALLDKIHLSENGLAYVVEGLKQSLDEKRATHDKDYDMLVREHSTLKNRLDKMYEDKLDGRVSDEFYDSKYAEYKNRLDDLAGRISLHNKADISYYEFGRKILELAKNAGKLFELAKPEEKRELLQFVLSNSNQRQ